MYNASLDSKRFEIEFCGNTNRNYSDNGQQDSSYSNIGSFLSNSQLNDEVHIKWKQVSDIFKPRGCQNWYLSLITFSRKHFEQFKATANLLVTVLLLYEHLYHLLFLLFL